MPRTKTNKHRLYYYMFSISPHYSKSFFSTPSVWQVINWLFLHKQYAGLSIALTEYALKIAIDNLPQRKRDFYIHSLHIIGLDVNKMGISYVGKTILNTVFNNNSGKDVYDSNSNSITTTVHFLEHLADNSHATAAITEALHSALSVSPQKGVESVLRSLMERIQKLAYDHIPDTSHISFANYLHASGWSQGNAISNEDINKEAAKHYGDSKWLDVGLATLNEKRAHFGAVAEDRLAQWLRDAHKMWQKWAVSQMPLLNKHGKGAVEKVSSLSSSATTAATTTSTGNISVASSRTHSGKASNALPS